MRGEGRRGEATRGRASRGAIAAAVLLSACWYPKERGQSLEHRVDRIEAEGPAPQSGADRAAAEELAKRIDAQLADLRKRIDALASAAQQSTADHARTEKLADEVSRLRGAVEQHSQRLEAAEKALAQARAAPPVQQQPPPRAARKPPAPVATPQLPEDKTLAFAREQELKGDKDVAREIYQELVNKYPTDPAAGEAHFRLGELAYGDGRFRDAIVEYGSVAKDFPTSDRAPDALLRTAESMLQVGLQDEAAAVLAQVPKRYPGTAAASRAKRRLAELGRAESVEKSR